MRISDPPHIVPAWLDRCAVAGVRYTEGIIAFGAGVWSGGGGLENPNLTPIGAFGRRSPIHRGTTAERDVDMSIFPLPVFETDEDPRHREVMADGEVYARLEPPKTIVVRIRYMKLVAEYTYNGNAKPGCGTKLVARTHRGTEIVEMLTTTCNNAGCSKSITRQEMRQGLSGGKVALRQSNR